MFRLLRLLLSLLVAVIVIYVAVAVPLGKRTLWQHLRSIAATRESQELVDGVKEKAHELWEHATDAGHPPPPPAAPPPDDRLTAKERERLRDLIRERLHDEPSANKK